MTIPPNTLSSVRARIDMHVRGQRKASLFVEWVHHPKTDDFSAHVSGNGLSYACATFGGEDAYYAEDEHPRSFGEASHPEYFDGQEPDDSEAFEPEYDDDLMYTSPSAVLDPAFWQTCPPFLLEAPKSYAQAACIDDEPHPFDDHPAPAPKLSAQAPQPNLPISTHAQFRTFINAYTECDRYGVPESERPVLTMLGDLEVKIDSQCMETAGTAYFFENIPAERFSAHFARTLAQEMRAEIPEPATPRMGARRI